jgi:uncharacterized membrane protein YhaH (DUF805 family)
MPGMTDTRYKIVFTGEVLPGFDLNTVKNNLTKLFNSDLERINTLFKGTTVDIKKDLGEAEAKQYFNALQKAGAQVRIEHDLSASLTLVKTEDHPLESTTPSTAKPMTCPKCGHEQVESPECVACGIIIERYLARQASIEQSAALATNQPSTPYAPPKSAVVAGLSEVGTLKVFTTDGRIGRLRYLAWSMTMFLVGAPIIAIFAISLTAALGTATDGGGTFAVIGGLLGVLGLIGLAVVSVMIGVQRLHDIGWSGWLILLNLVPAIGSVFALLMFLIPGSTEANRYGPPPPPNSTAVNVMASLCLILIVGGFLSAFLVPGYFAFLESTVK